jgi:peptidoglycan/xylan/chitin deacetylase (PgdA/CDA1 family)
MTTSPSISRESTARALSLRALVTLFAAILAMTALTPAAARVQSRPRQLAITIDDGPSVEDPNAPGVPMKDLAKAERVAAGLMAALRAEHAPATIFINEGQLNAPGERDARAKVLENWLDAGFDLGNHTYSHVSANREPLEKWEDEFVQGEVITRKLVEARGKKLRYFRFPNLHSGVDAASHQALLDFTAKRGYRSAPITVNYTDYIFAGPYTRQLGFGHPDVAEKIKQAYLDQVDPGFEFAEKSSIEVFGYELPQILLIHCSELNSVALGNTLAKMRKRGYQFITLDEAMKDPAYQRPDTFAGPGGSWTSLSATALGKTITGKAPVAPQWIVDLPRTAR